MITPAKMPINARFRNMERVSDLADLLREPVMELFRYAASPRYEQFEIPKGKKGKRVIMAPHPDLKSIQKRLNRILQAVYREDCPSCNHGFVGATRSRYAKTIITNAAVHVNRGFVLNMDIKDFFDSISANRVRQHFLSLPFCFNIELATCIALLCTHEKKLPTGAPTSPVLSNMVCLASRG